MRALSTRCRPSVLCGVLYRSWTDDRHPPAVLADALVLHLAGDQREERVVASESDAGAGRDLGPALADQDGPRVDDLTAVDLDAEHLGVRVAAVARRAATFLVCHLLRLLLRAAARRLLGSSLFRDRLRLLFHDLGLGHGSLLRGRGLGPAPGLGLVLLGGLRFLHCSETDPAYGDD